MDYHVEGGYFKRTNLSDLKITPNVVVQNNSKIKTLANELNGEYGASSAILFMLTDDAPVSHLHRLAHQDEMWHYYTGNSPIVIVELLPDKNGQLAVKETILGNEI